MVEKIHMFKEGKGRHFLILLLYAKNHLILKNNGNYKRWKQNFTSFRDFHQHGILKMIFMNQKKIMNSRSLRI